MLTAIISHTPTWVWVVFAALLALGLSQTVRRRVSRARLAALPLTLLAFGIWSLAQRFAAQPLLLLLWATALVLAAALASRLLRTPAGAQWHATEQRLELPGSWLPLVLIVGVFLLRYALTVAQVLHPEWQATVAVPQALLLGAISGVFAGRAWALLRLTLPATGKTGRMAHGSGIGNV